MKHMQERATRDAHLWAVADFEQKIELQEELQRLRINIAVALTFLTSGRSADAAVVLAITGDEVNPFEGVGLAGALELVSTNRRAK